MRDPARIDDFCRRLAVCWKQMPDVRFGQFIVNMFAFYGGDPFYVEDEKMIRFIEDRVVNSGNINYIKGIGD